MSCSRKNRNLSIGSDPAASSVMKGCSFNPCQIRSHSARKSSDAEAVDLASTEVLSTMERRYRRRRPRNTRSVGAANRLSLQRQSVTNSIPLPKAQLELETGGFGDA